MRATTVGAEVATVAMAAEERGAVGAAAGRVPGRAVPGRAMVGSAASGAAGQNAATAGSAAVGAASGGAMVGSADRATVSSAADVAASGGAIVGSADRAAVASAADVAAPTVGSAADGAASGRASVGLAASVPVAGQDCAAVGAVALDPAALDLAALDLAALDLAALEAAASEVLDPELPVVTLGDLGIVRGVSLADDGAVEVRITPTFVGCPATEVIAADVRVAVAARLRDAGAPDVEVRTRTAMSPPWSTDWISDDGRRKLAEHGVAPPRGGRRGGPVLLQISPSPSPHPPTQKSATHERAVPERAVPERAAPARAPQACPHCGSADTRELSAFGSTPCQSLRACRACGEPFGAMKSL